MTTPQPTEKAPESPHRRPGASWWQAGSTGVVAAVAANLLLWGAGHLVGASMAHPDRTGSIVDVAVGDVVLATAVPFTAGFCAAVALSLLWRGFLRTAQITGSALALATIAGSLSLDTDTATRAVLALMHLALVPAGWLSLEAVRRRTLS
ncbi:DUF6069 family protein [Thermobifida halotolerans]|uniref:DUF6069 family protein n=1 Tax=Thermobifida halotolerans TaxID=483545 RepID=UPI000A017384|nr:DUF6069 family protein [Thermobifida halotolerans]